MDISVNWTHFQYHNKNDLLLPALTIMINRLLLYDEVPSEFRTAVVKPLLKRPALIPTKWKTIARSRIFHFYQRSLKKLSWCSSQIIWLPTILHTNFYTQISICLPSWSQYRNSSTSCCQWHSHSFWWQLSFYSDFPWFVGCFWHLWPLHTVEPIWTTFWCL